MLLAPDRMSGQWIRGRAVTKTVEATGSLEEARDLVTPTTTKTFVGISDTTARKIARVRA